MAASQPSVLITGGAGFIGSALVRQWLEHEPERVVNLDKLTYAGLRASLTEVVDHPRHLLVEGDVADAALVRELFIEHRPQAVLHLAAETHVDRSIDEPPQFAQTNVLGTCTLLDQATRYWMGLSGAARDRFRFLYMSTDEVFGAAGPNETFTAESPLAANSPYAASKAAGEHLVHAFSHTYGLPVVTINPTNNYGPRQLPEKLIPKMILAAARHEELPIYGDGLQERDWLHVDDCCHAIRVVLRHGHLGSRYLAGADNCLANLAVVERICDLLDEKPGGGGEACGELPSGLSLRVEDSRADAPARRALIRHVADRPGHDRRYAVDSRPLRQLGWNSRVDFTGGLRETVQWYLNNPDWTAAAVASLERRESGNSPAG
jgi:dTDP-glucose 4,6-dehydratase